MPAGILGRRAQGMVACGISGGRCASASRGKRIIATAVARSRGSGGEGSGGGGSGKAGRWVLGERGVERGYGSARARTEQSGERGEDPGRRKGKDLTRGPGLSVGDATSASCGLSGVRGEGEGRTLGRRASRAEREPVGRAGRVSWARSC